ncbi:MAG: S41 family peptidase [Micropepsaceae bacterium]
MRILYLLLLTSLAAAPAFGAAAPSAREVQRLEDLGRIWIYADLFDPYLGASGAEWDQALIEAIPAARAAQDDAALTAAINAMLRRSGDPAARVVATDPSATTPLPPPVRKERGTWIADCNAMAQAVTTGAAPLQLAENIAAQPTIVDCRAFVGDQAALRAVIAAIARTRTMTELPAGSALVRSYSGFPAEAGASSGRFVAGFGLIGKGTLAPGKASPTKTPLVFIMDTAAAAAELPAIAALQSAGQARVVSGGPIGAGLATMRTARITIQISEGLYTYPAGAVGFRPDAIATSQTALAKAITELAAKPSAVLREPSLPPLQRPPRRYKDAGVPTTEQRLLALFRMWGTIAYFHPYKSLMDRPWDATLSEFVPIMLAADTRAAYEAALLRLAARTHDSHTRIEGLTAAPFGFGGQKAPIRARFIEGRLAITQLDDATLSPKLKIGDEILAVDGTSVGVLEQRMTTLLAASTPQAFRAAVANRILSGPPGSTAALWVRSPRASPRTVRVARVAPKAAPATQAWRILPGNVGYIDLENLGAADADRALDELMPAKAIVFDLRGQPQGTGWAIGARLAKTNGPFAVARFRRAAYQGPPKDGAGNANWLALSDVQRPAAAKRYTGRVFALIDERTASQAEHTALIFKAAANATFVGTTTNGTIGDVTNVTLPGGLLLRFTGHDVRPPDGRQLQRIGLKPDVTMNQTLRSLRNRRDDVLEKALDLARR